MIDKIITDSYYFNSVVLTIFSLFVVSTVFILNCLWCRKKVNTHVSDRFFKVISIFTIKLFEFQFIKIINLINFIKISF